MDKKGNSTKTAEHNTEQVGIKTLNAKTQKVSEEMKQMIMTLSELEKMITEKVEILDKKSEQLDKKISLLEKYINDIVNG